MVQDAYPQLIAAPQAIKIIARIKQARASSNSAFRLLSIGFFLLCATHYKHCSKFRRG